MSVTYLVKSGALSGKLVRGTPVRNKEDRGQYTFARGEPITTLKSLETLNFLIDALDALHEKHGLVSLSLDELAVFVTQAPEALKGLDSYRHP
ncbi:hypothetical protein ABG067_003477 [Albugo candida]